MTQWYYEDAGKPQGPISEPDLMTMFTDRHLSATTRVWNEGFGTEWRPAHETVFAQAQAAPPGSPPPLAAQVPPPPQAAVQPISGPAPDATVTATSYRATYATLVAVVPIIIMVLEMVVLAAGVSPNEPAFDRGGIWWTAILSFGFAYKDAKAISAAGLNPQGRTMVPFLFLTQIGYFLRRKSVAGLSLKPLWIWLGAIVIYVVWAGIAYA